MFMLRKVVNKVPFSVKLRRKCSWSSDPRGLWHLKCPCKVSSIQPLLQRHEIVEVLERKMDKELMMCLILKVPWLMQDVKCSIGMYMMLIPTVWQCQPHDHKKSRLKILCDSQKFWWNPIGKTPKHIMAFTMMILCWMFLGPAIWINGFANLDIFQ